MDKRFVSVFLTIAMALSLIGFVAPVAQATHTEVDEIQQFMPDGDERDKDQLSDAFDGQDTAAHLTTVAEEDANQVTWFVCPENPVETPGANDDANCTEIGTDTAGVQPEDDPDEPDPDTDKAFELLWDIPSAFDSSESGERFDVIARACTGNPVTNEQDDGSGQHGVPDNCRDDREQNIYLDDASFPAGGGQDLPAGEIVGICVDPAAHEADDENCDENSDDFIENGHGSTTPEDDFIVYFTTSDDLDETDSVGACADEDANAEQEPDDCDEWYSDSIMFDANSNFNEWNATFEGVSLNGEYDLGIYGFDDDGESGDANFPECFNDDWNDDFNACVLDEHYKVGVETDIGPGTGEEFGVGATFELEEDTECEDDRDKEETNNVTDREVVIGCLFDQFDRPEQGAMTFESDGVGGFVTRGRDCAFVEYSDPADDGDVDASDLTEGVAHDHDNDDFFEHCHVTSDEHADNEASNDSEVAVIIEADDNDEDTDDTGDQTVTVCEDDDDEIEDDEDTGHGCDSDEESDSVLKHWVGDIDHVHLFYAGTEAADCETGDQFKENRVQDTETLVVCVHDEDDNPVSTVPSGNGNLDWDISTDSVTFTQAPPRETDDDGEATVQIRAVEGGSAVITVDVEDCDNCDDPDVDDDSLRKFVRGPGGGQPAQCNNGVDDDGDGLIDFPDDPGCVSLNDDSEENQRRRRVATNKTIRYNRRATPPAFKGQDGSSVKRCQVGRLNKLKKKRPGRDRVVGRDRSNRRGNWKIVKRRARGRYYAVATPKRFTNRRGVLIICLRDRSPTIRVRRR